MAEDQQPPRKRARYNAPTSDYSGDNASRGDDDAGRNTEATAVRIPRIRIKMSESHRPIISTRRLGDTNGEEDEVVEMESDDVTMTPATQEPSDAAEEGLRWEDQEVREMVDPEESWRVIGLSNVGNTCFTNAILQVFSSVLVAANADDRQTEILGEYFIRRYEYIPPSLTTITNPLTSADLSSRSSRSKTRRNQIVEQEPPALTSLYSHHLPPTLI